MTGLQISPFTADDVLRAMHGVSYVVSVDGSILMAGGSQWALYARLDPSAPTTQTWVGRDFFAIIQGVEVRQAYRRLHEKALSAGTQIAFEFRCDGPDVERRMMMAMTPVKSRAGAVAVLYQCTLISAKSRVALPYLDWLNGASEEGKPMVVVCAWCADVRLDGQWVKPEAYYGLGGSADIQLSHGICPSCTDGVIEPLLSDQASDSEA